MGFDVRVERIFDLRSVVFGHRFPDVWIVPRGSDRAVPMVFEAALAHHLGLDGLRPGFSARLVEEYRRYLCLVALSDAPVIPSPRIAAVARLHGFATGAPPLPRGLSGMAGVTARARAEGAASFAALYRDTFGVAPPRDIWPGAAERRARRCGAGLMAMSAAGIWLVLAGAASFGPLPVLALLAGLTGLFTGCSLLTEGAIGDGAPCPEGSS